jgi:hypothetical protein
MCSDWGPPVSDLQDWCAALISTAALALLLALLLVMGG